MTTTHTYDLFIAHSVDDRAWVEGYLLDTLKQAGTRCFTEAQFTLGAPRLLEYERVVQQSQRVLLVLSPSYLGDDFTAFLDLMAQSYGLETASWPIIPLLLQPVPLPPRLAILTALDATNPDEWSDSIERLCASLQLPPPQAAPPPACPYLGMMPFKETDASRFFGREQEVQEMLDRLRLHPFLTVIGRSGSGKSSLVFAGLLPKLRKSALFGPGEWLILSMRPGELPLVNLAAALQGNPIDPLHNLPALFGATPQAKRLLLVVDQFEETFTVAHEDVVVFQETLQRLSEMPNCYVVLTVRADFYPDLMTTPLWPLIRAHRLEVIPLDERGLRRAIVRPAEDVGVFIEPALVERLAADAAGEPGVLPLVQETMVLLWERLHRRFLSLNAYESLVLSSADYGFSSERTGLQVAIARRADAALANLTPEQQAIARRIFMRLVQFGQGRADTRRQQRLVDLRSQADDPRSFDQTLRHLTNSFLLTLTGEERMLDRKVDIAHEALIVGWPTLRGWIDTRRETEQTRRRLEDKANEWVRLGQNQGGLLDETELGEAERWLHSTDATDLGYDHTLTALIEASRAEIMAEAAEKEAIRQRELANAQALAEAANAQAKLQAEAARNLRIRAWILAFVGVAAVISALFGFSLWFRATRAQNSVEALALASQASTYLDTDTDLSLDLALAAIERDTSAPIRDTVRRTLLASHDASVLKQHEAGVWNVVWSPDGTKLASSDNEGMVLIWNAETKEVITRLIGHRDRVRALAWSPDGTRLATGSGDLTIQIWQMGNLQQKEIRQSDFLLGHTGGISALAWSPDSRMLISGGSDDTLRLWDVPSQRAVLAINENAGDINGLDWSPDGSRIAYAADDHTIRIWQVEALLRVNPRSCVFHPLTSSASNMPTDLLRAMKATCELPSEIVLKGHRDQVLDVAWSSDGTRLASASNDADVRIWSAQGGPSRDVLTGHTLAVNSIAWSHDDLHLISASYDTTVRVWHTETGKSEFTLTGHTDWVWAAQFSPDDQTIASVSADRTVRLHLTANNPSVRVITDPHGIVRSVDWHANNMLAFGDYGGVIELWDANTEQSTQIFSATGRFIHQVRWNKTGDKLAFVNGASEGSDGSVHVWQSGERTVIAAQTVGAYQIAWSPDGTQLAGVSRNGSVRVWDVATRRVVASSQIERARLLSIDWKPDGSQLAISSATGLIKILDPKTLAVLGTYPGHASSVWSVAWNPAGTLLATAGQDKVTRIWDATKIGSPPIATLANHKLAVNGVAWSPDGSKLATTSDDFSVGLWDVATRQDIAILNGPTRGFWTPTWSPDGRRVAAGTVDNAVWIYYADFQDILPIALERRPNLIGPDASKYLQMK